MFKIHLFGYFTTEKVDQKAEKGGVTYKKIN